MQCRDRVAGYRRALRDFQVPFDESLIYHGKYDIQTGVEAVPFLLGKKVTAALCCSDTLAFGVYREMRNLHRRIPEDLSVVSVDDTVLADIIQPPLTSVSQPIPDVAAQAVSTLIRLIHHPEQSLKPIPKLEPTLKVRASVSRILV
ncbi:MAG: substrate-binding domain-containing protein [Christensenellales bacterium]